MQEVHAGEEMTFDVFLCCFHTHSSHFQEHEELLHSRDIIRDLRMQV